MNYLTPKTRKEILDLLVTGLKRLEYRGYDSAGLAIDSNDGKDIVLIKRSGKVQILEDAINQGMLILTLTLSTALAQSRSTRSRNYFIYSNAKEKNSKLYEASSNKYVSNVNHFVQFKCIKQVVRVNTIYVSSDDIWLVPEGFWTPIKS